MTEKQTGNFQENIHLAAFEEQYRAKLLQNTDIADFYRDKESLNGQWHYGIDQYDTCLRAKWFEEKTHDSDGRPFPLDFSFDSWPKIKVPSCWNTQDDKLFLYEGSVVYTRTFSYKNHGEDRVFLKFGGANYQAAVFVNKAYLGMHMGGSTPFCVEITDVIKSENRLTVVVNNTRRRTNVPCENTDWFNYGGLYREVSLLRLPKAFVRKAALALEPGSGFARVCAQVLVDGAESGVATLRIAELGIEKSIKVENGSGSLSFEASPVLWQPEAPKLYDVEFSFGSDTLRERVGFREITVNGLDIMLNGKAIYLNGICAHEESVANGKAVTEAEIRENYRLAKEMNCNYMRLAHYPHSEAAARIADEVGMLLWEEIPVYWAIEFENPATYSDAENQLTELIMRDQNRASVIIWSVGNENADTAPRLHFMSRLAQKARGLDTTRLLSAA